MAPSSQPILIGATAQPDGRLRLVFSVTPGHRITVVTPDTGDTEDLAAQIVAAVIPLIGRARREAGRQ